MSSQRSNSWASVVAHGIIDEPMKLLKEMEVLPSKAATSLSSLSPPPPPLPTTIPTPTPTTSVSPTLTFVSTSPISHTLSPRLTNSMDNEIEIEFDVDATSCVKGLREATWFRSKNDLQTKLNFRRPFRNNWPRHPSPFPDYRYHHHRSSNPGVFYRPRRHHYSSTHLHPRCPVPQSWQPRVPRPMIKHPLAGFNTFVDPEKRRLPKYYPPMPQMPPMPTPLNMEEDKLIATAAQSRHAAYEWKQPSIRSSQNNGDEDEESESLEQSNYGTFDLLLSNKEDSTERHRACVSPQARARCQITFSVPATDSTQWQTISKSRRVWEPLDPGQRESQDPSNPIPAPPPGFEHVVPGKRALSGRARQLMGEHVEFEAPKDYSTPEPIPMPERELREQQHFLANHDTHLSCRQAQLRVTNGCTGDGYYVRPLAKLMPKLTKLSPPSKYQSSYQPNVSYWASETQKVTDADCVKTRKFELSNFNLSFAFALAPLGIGCRPPCPRLMMTQVLMFDWQRWLLSCKEQLLVASAR
ncbi:hypothetical protein ACLKA6_008164 [Drosophila palustris]